MISLFYLSGMLNAIYIIMFVALVFCAVAFLSSFIDEFFTNPEKVRKISAYIGSVCLIWILFVPSGDTYLKMKAADKIGEQRIEDVFDLLDQKLIEAVEEAELIDYD